jgi:serine/threonine protein kinase
MDQLIGQSLDRYKIISLLGEGGMGAVLKARDMTLQRDVAIKIMHAQFARAASFQERFLQEARTAARLDHPGVVKVFDFGQARSLLYIVMEFIPGDNLRKLLKDLRAANKGIVLEEALRLARQVCLALDYIHHQGILHRDIKPDNIMLKSEASDGLPYRPVLTDLGLAKLAEGGMLTQDGVSMGTPAYMSPEQALGEKTDARSDVYSLGILLFELVVGQLPFPAKTLSEAIRYHTQTPPPPPHTLRADVPEPVEAIILKALAKSPADRYQDAASMANAIDEVLPAATKVAALSTVMAATVSLHTQLQQSLVSARGDSILQEFPKAPADLSQDSIQVLDASQKSRSFPMKPNGLTIGREAGNDVVINSPKVSRQHARIDFEGTDYRVVDLDSTNGTYLGNIKLLPGMPQVWTPDKALRIGDAWLRLLRVAPTGGSAPTGTDLGKATRVETNVAQTSTGSDRIGLFMDTTQFSVAPGAAVTIPMVILNQGNVVDHFKVGVEGIPGNWVTSASPEIQLLPGSQKDVAVTIQPPLSPKSRAGRYPLAIRASSLDAPDQVSEARVILTVTAFSKFTSEMKPQRIQAGQNAQINVHNDGNTPETYTILWDDRAEELAFEPPQAKLNVPEGGSASTNFVAMPRKRLWIGGAKTSPFNAHVSSPAGQVISHDGEVVSKALFPVWIVPALLLLCLCASAAAFAGYKGYTGQIASVTQTQSANQTAIALLVLGARTPTLTSTPLVLFITATPGPTTAVPTLAPTDEPTFTPTDTQLPPTLTPTFTPTLLPTSTSTNEPTSTPTQVPTPTNTPPPPNYALQFNGGSDYVSIHNNGSLNLASSFSVEAWVKPLSLASPSTYKGILRGAIGAPPGDSGSVFTLFLDRTDYSSWGLSVCTPSCSSAASGSGSLKVNAWQFLASTYDGSTITIYLNGTKVASQSHTGSLGSYAYLVVGLWSSSFNGLIDDVRLWNVARSESEVKADMNSSPTGSVPGLKGYWRFDEGSGQAVNDSTANHNNGLLGAAGDPAWVLANRFIIIKIIPTFILPLPLFPTPTP